MGSRTSTTGEFATGFEREVFDAARRSVASRPRKWLIAITLLAGLFSAVAINAVADPVDRTFATLSGTAQTLMSVTVPLMGILLVSDLRKAHRPTKIFPTLLAAVGVAVLVAVFGVLVCVVLTAVAPSEAPEGRWHHLAEIAAGSVLVQVVAQLVGTGLGLLVRRPAVAFLASIVLPLTLWLVLGAVDALHPAQAWLAPYTSAMNLLAGRMSPIRWAHWLAVFLIWGIGLNALGAIRWRSHT